MSAAPELYNRWEEAMTELAQGFWVRLVEKTAIVTPYAIDRGMFELGFVHGAESALTILAASEQLYEVDDELRPQPIAPLEWVAEDEDDRDPGVERLMELVVEDYERRREILLDAFLRRLGEDDPE